MYVLGKPGGVCRPNGFLEGPAGQLPITGFDAFFSVGSIPLARVGLIPEFLSQIADAQTNDLYRVRVRDGDGEYFTLFKGYVAGECGHRDERSFTSGINLIHPARDLDQMRLSSPSLHPESADDWSYRRQGTRDVAGGGTLGIGDVFFRAENPDPLPKQLIDNTVAFLERLSVDVERGQFGFKTEGYGPARELLKKVVSLNGRVRSGIAGALAIEDGPNAINSLMREMVVNSLAGRRSVWDTLCAVMGEFGLLLVCDNAGGIFVTADAANFLPPDGNVLDGDYVLTHDHEARFARTFKEVMLISNNVVAAPDANGAGGPPIPGTVACWPPPGQGDPDDPGATLSLLLPPWLTPISFQNDPEAFRQEPPGIHDPIAGEVGDDGGDDQRAAVAKAQQAYAKMLFNLERDKLRTFALNGPLAPTVVPGTTAYISPYSAVRPKSGGELKDINATFTGYCYSVNHHVECQGRAAMMTTGFQFRNVSRVQDGLNVDEHPIFSDVKPFRWRESAGDRD